MAAVSGTVGRLHDFHGIRVIGYRLDDIFLFEFLLDVVVLRSTFLAMTEYPGDMRR